MTPYLTLGLAGLTLAAVAFAGVQSVRLSDSQADLATATERLTETMAERDQAVRDRTLSVTVMTQQRDRAVAAERQAGKLKADIEACRKDPECDGKAARVLLDTIYGLGKGDRT